MGAFSGLKTASRGFQSNPLRPGRYVVRIDECSFFDTEQKGEMWKNTLTILAVEEGDHKPGEQVHTFFKVGAGKQVFQRNLKAFLAGVLDVADDEIGEEEGLEAASDGSPMLGLVTVVTARRQTSQKTKDEDGNPVQYTVYSWTPSLTDDEIREALGEEGMTRFFPNGL